MRVDPSSDRPSVARTSALGCTACLVLVLGLLVARASDALTLIGPGIYPSHPLAIIDASDPPNEDYRVESDPCVWFEPGYGCVQPPTLFRSATAEVRSGAQVGSIEAVAHAHVDALGGDIDRIDLRDTSSLRVGATASRWDPYIYQINAYDDTALEIEGGSILYTTLSGRSTLLQTGPIYGSISVLANSRMTLQSGPEGTSADSGVFMSGHGSLRMITGRITDNGLQAGGDATIEMLGGTIDVSGVWLTGNASMLWRGGAISDIDLFDLTTMIIVGDLFEVDGVPVPLGAITAASGLLTGRLESGESFSVPFSRASGTSLVLVPEPTTCLLVGIGLLMLGVRHRSRS